jgi:hypothetical protein
MGMQDNGQLVAACSFSKVKVKESGDCSEIVPG